MLSGRRQNFNRSWLVLCIVVLFVQPKLSEGSKMQDKSGRSTQYAIPMVVVFLGDSKDTEMRQPLQQIAILSVSDLNALWQELGFDTENWSPAVESEPLALQYPILYAIQGYIIFEYECHYHEVPTLLAEAERALLVVHSEAAKRALAVIIGVAKRETASGRGMSFRPSMISVPQNSHII